MSAEWPSEENIVTSVVSHLKQAGWMIESVADTEARAPGADIRAARSDETLIVEAKGYPATVYARGENKGKAHCMAKDSEGVKLVVFMEPQEKEEFEHCGTFCCKPESTAHLIERFCKRTRSLPYSVSSPSRVFNERANNARP